MSATWDSKGIKATPISLDEILIIDTEDSRNQKRATLSSVESAIWSRNAGSGFIFPTTLTDTVGIGVNTPLATLHVTSAIPDTTSLLIKETTGTNGGIINTFIGNRDPNGNVTAAGGAEYLRDSGAISKRYLSREVTTGTAWDEYSTNPPNIIEIKTLADFDDLASGGVVTISTNTTFILKASITTANRIVINTGIILHIVSQFIHDQNITYSGTGTFITTAGGTFSLQANAGLSSSSTGTLLSFTGTGIFEIQNSRVLNWDNLGTFTDGRFFTTFSTFTNIDSGWTITDPIEISVDSLVIIGTPFTGSFYTVNSKSSTTAIIFNIMDVEATSSTTSILDISTEINNDILASISRISVSSGEIFKQTTVANATINSVADSSPATGTITAFADDVTGVSTTVSSTTTYFDNEEVTITGTTSYNGTFQIFGVVAGVSFKILRAFVADDATGSIDSNRIEMTLAGGHGVTTGMNIKVIDTNFYNLFYTVLNVVTNDITLNQVFVSTNTGEIERNVSLDETDTRIEAQDLGPFPHSHEVITAFVNDNTTVNGTIINDVFTDLTFGTTGDALISGTTMEEWKLVNELNGTFEHIGNTTFDGAIVYDFTVTSTGGTVDFRFKWVKKLFTTITASTIAFVDSNPDTITDSGNGFLTAGFKPDDTISVSGSTSNDGNYTIATVTAGTITLVASDSLTGESAGASVTINGLFGNLPDNVEALVAVGSDAQSISKHFPLLAVKGDQVKPQITRDSGSSGITTLYATIYATD